ncbi:MAG TPA: hypothetical protein VFS43_38280 [Polyangiaceae bacterium]|nr:hypothetical protein [Polyangiaceae bacterium]
MNDAPHDPPSPERLARQAYAAACAATGPLPHDGRKLPPWLGLSPETRAKLVEAVRSALAEAPCLCPLCRTRREPSPTP